MTTAPSGRSRPKGVLIPQARNRVIDRFIDLRRGGSFGNERLQRSARFDVGLA